MAEVNYLHNTTEDSDLLEEALNSIMSKYMVKDVVYPLLLSDPQSTHRNLDKAGALYQCAMTSIRFSQFRRASWYVLALNTFLCNHFGCKPQQ